MQQGIQSALLNRLDDALLTVRLAAERKLESASLLLTQYFVAFLG
jgi:hypothetical protein